MKYIKVFENYFDDYQREFKKLEDKYKDKINKSLLSLLNKLSNLEHKDIIKGARYYEQADTVLAISCNNKVIEMADDDHWTYIDYQNNGSICPIDDLTTLEKVKLIKELIEKFSFILNKEVIKKMNK